MAEGHRPPQEPTPDLQKLSGSTGTVPYGSTTGKSGVRSYEIKADSIIVNFTSGGSYEYTRESTGASNLEQLKRLAARGSGLHAFLNQATIKGSFARKL
jgi:hypothetical protein